MTKQQFDIPDTNSSAQQKKGRLIFLMMAIFFMVPVVVVVAMIKFDWKPSGSSYGELLRPARQIQLVNDANATDGEALKPFWQDKWNMVYVADACNEACMNKLQDMRQIHVSTYKHIMRVQRVLITQQQNVADIQAKYPKLMILNEPANQVGVLMAQFNINDELAAKSDRLYLVDPLGFIMMSYPSDREPAKIRKELLKLLKFSWAG